jgi:hypothetical protein
MTKEYMKQKWADYRINAFWDRVDRRADDECWDWNGLRQQSRKNPTPYGVLGWKGKNSRAHRVAYELANGAIPEGMMLVPKEPTPEMIDAGCPVGEFATHFDMRAVYKAMLSAAPEHKGEK